MGAGQDAGLANNLPDRREVAAIDALGGLKNARANEVLLGLLEGRRHIRCCHGVGALGNELGHDRLLHLGDAVATLLLGRDGIGIAQTVIGDPGDLCHQLGIVDLLDFPRLLGRLLSQLDDCLNDRLETLVACLLYTSPSPRDRS